MILTFADKLFVEFTAQVTVLVSPAYQTSVPKLGELTTNGPVVFTVITTLSLLVWPTCALLSLTVNLKFKVLATDGNTSQVGVWLATIASILGKTLAGLVVGKNERKTGPAVLVETGGCAPPSFVSYCSQQYVKTSPTVGSEDKSPFKINGVLLGMV